MMLSGEADIDVVSQAVNDGSIYKFITKPWSNDNLRAIVREAAEQAAVQAGVEDSHGIHGQHEFCAKLEQLIPSDIRIVAIELRNASVHKVMEEGQREVFFNELRSRCALFAKALIIDVARLEPSLFAFAMPTDASHVEMQHFINELTKPFYLGDQVSPMRIAMGYTDLTANTSSTATVALREALIALTATSFSGEVTAFSSDIQVDLNERHSLERDLHSALKNGEFFLQFQPQVDTQTLNVRGAEALCRWAHPERGAISPLQFIDLAERTGFIDELGLWVIGQCCRMLEYTWQMGLKSRLSFNISPRQFNSRIWVDALLDFVATRDIPANLLEVEVTESTIMDDPDRAISLLNELKAAGLNIAMDDFGTGHSSLSLINQLPIDVLKLDRSLVQRVEEDKKSLTLFTRLVEMAHELGLETIAEGVETQGQVTICQALNCTLIQGYALYAPVDMAEFVELARSGHKRH
jgi:EAL domain-containing protein (putative c-di-GMP-specific phosphodiesterase class I)